MKSHIRITKICFFGIVLMIGLAYVSADALAQSVNLLSIQDEITDPGILTLNQCLSIAETENIGLMRTRLGIEAGILDRIRNESAFDPGFSFDFTYKDNDSSGSSGGSSSTDLGLGYQQPLWNGSSWSLSLDQTRADGSTDIDGTSANYTNYSSQLGLAYTMPILEGFGDRVNRIGVEKSDIGITRSEIAVSDARRSLRYSVIQAYIGSVLAAKQVEVAQLSLDTAQNLVERTQALIDVGQLAQYELLAAQSGLAQRQEAVINAQTSLVTSLDNLKSIIGLPIGQEVSVDPGILREIFLDINPDDLFLTAQQNRPDFKDFELRIRQSQLDLFLATDRRQASLNWNTVFSLGGQQDTYTRSVGDMNKFNWYTGLQYRLPLGGNRAANVDVASVNLQLNQLELEKTDFLRTLETQIRSASEEFSNAMLRIEVTAEGLHVQEVKMESEYARLDLGLITSRDILQFDLDLANARLAYETAIADTITSLSKLEFLTGRHMIEDAIVINDLISNAEVQE
ncbi:MAG: TolC family protein [bacterium]|nr:TolC family protein [bacterium]